MALHGSACANLSPILFKGNNRSLGVNVIIHRDVSGSMDPVNAFYADGSFIEILQDSLLAEKIGDDVSRYPNLYATFDVYSKNPSSPFNISNPNGTIAISQAFMLGQATGSATRTDWQNSYWGNTTSHVVDICTDVIGGTTNGRLLGVNNDTTGGSPKSEDIHGCLWSIWTSPNAISTGNPGRFGSILGSSVRKGSTTIVITNSDEQENSPGDMINQLVDIDSSGTNERTINGSTGEMISRGYRIIGLHSYASTDGYVGVLFYGFTSSQPYGYVNFPTTSTFTITRSSTPPSSWIKTTSPLASSSPQIHDMLTLASETRGGLFKIGQVFANVGTDNREAFAKCLASFIADTV